MSVGITLFVLSLMFLTISAFVHLREGEEYNEALYILNEQLLNKLIKNDEIKESVIPVNTFNIVVGSDASICLEREDKHECFYLK
ncbi:hypothetical protein [Bacillus coahuilensis]|uniref:hypothetical protein n=1 Tax=Bacillus coahuilensis TaxID=408580 RepID=UPI00058F8C61|nr:hypothetical protein [Bacillus coahuilensis]